MWNRTRTIRIRLAFTREMMKPFHTEPLAVPELVHLESRSRTKPSQKFSSHLPEPFSSDTLRNEAKRKFDWGQLTITGKFAPEKTFCKVSMNKCVVEKFF